MSEVDDAFVQATDDLISLYRSVERRTLDLPLVSFMPMLLCFWAIIKFSFFLYVGIVLIIPVNLVIFIRNIFPGYWRYRPFFLTYLHYVWLWIWRGETLTVPFVFVRPLFNVFMKGHFERRLRRLRLETLLNDGLSDATRTALIGRLDAALERWKTPRFAALFYTLMFPAILAIPTWYKQFIEFLGSIGIRMPTDVVVSFISDNVSTKWMVFLALLVPAYLIAIPVTAFLAKRGLFLGSSPDKIYFPGGQDGAGVYQREREILKSVGLHARELPIDFWTLGALWVVSQVSIVLFWDQYVAYVHLLSTSPYLDPSPPEVRQINEMLKSNLLFQVTFQGGLYLAAFLVAAFRRRRTGRL
jgi:hypothetical protein